MSNTVNKKLLCVLVERMKSNPGIAGGYTKDSKEVVARFWCELVEELNTAGPPIKTTAEWKKVWVDQKRYVRKKASEEYRHSNGTGGGAPKKTQLSSTDQAIFDLVRMKESVEGVGGSNIFGAPLTDNEDLQCIIENVDINCTENAIIFDPTPSPAPSSNRKSFNMSKREKSANELIETEVKNQEQMCQKMSEMVEVMKEDIIETRSVSKRIADSLEKMNDLKEKEIKEQVRHHAQIEKYRQIEIENKLEKCNKLIELENIKISILKQKNN